MLPRWAEPLWANTLRDNRGGGEEKRRRKAGGEGESRRGRKSENERRTENRVLSSRTVLNGEREQEHVIGASDRCIRGGGLQARANLNGGELDEEPVLLRINKKGKQMGVGVR